MSSERDLFHQGEVERSARPPSAAPLAWRMRPKRLAEVVGQEELTASGGGIGAMAEAGVARSSIFYGPPGTGKTTVAELWARAVEASFVPLVATEAGVSDVKKTIAAARERWDVYGRGTIVFLDEIHRFNKGQQDVLLPAVENGTLTLIGATTENPWVALNAALTSRCLLIEFKPLSTAAITTVLERAWARRGEWWTEEAEIDEGVLSELAARAAGDARLSLNLLERAALVARKAGRVRLADLDAIWREAPHYHDRGDRHYDLTSAMIKSLRGSDPDAALYWFGRLLAGGEDPEYIMRRVMIHAAEDVGLADPTALILAEAAYQALRAIGLPEARIPMAEALIYVAMAPKSNGVVASLAGLDAALKTFPAAPVPDAIRDRHYNPRLSEPYRYPHDAPDHFLPDPHLPPALRDLALYQPTASGREAALGERLREWRRRRRDGR